MNSVTGMTNRETATWGPGRGGWGLSLAQHSIHDGWQREKESPRVGGQGEVLICQSTMKMQAGQWARL